MTTRGRHRSGPHADLLDGGDRAGDFGATPAAGVRGIARRAAVVVHDGGGGPVARDQVRAHAVLVPTTTRTPAQYGRVRLPGGPTRVRHDQQRRAHPGRRRRRTGAGGPAVQDRIAAAARRSRSVSPASTAWRTTPGCATGRSPTTCSATWSSTSPRCRPDFLAAWTGWCADRGWVVSMQGRKIYALPARADQGGRARRGRPAGRRPPAAGRRRRRAGRRIPGAWPTPRSGRRTASCTRTVGRRRMSGSPRTSACSPARRSCWRPGSALSSWPGSPASQLTQNSLSSGSAMVTHQCGPCRAPPEFARRRRSAAPPPSPLLLAHPDVQVDPVLHRFGLRDELEQHPRRRPPSGW